MSEVWPLRTLGDLVTLQRGIDLPDSQRKPGSVPIMGSFGITGRHDTAACKGPGVTVGRSGGSIGTVAYIDEDYWPLNTCLYVRDFHGNDPLFCYYFLKTMDLAAHNSGSAQPSLNRNYVHPLPVRFPDLLGQDAIAATLGALDDKIELNRKMNATLEAMARALFRDWFVDFGPTRAKMKGRAPYLSPDLWPLFPDRLDDEGKPEGWEVFRLGDLTDHHSRTISPSDSPSKLFEHFSLPAFDKGQNPALDRGDTIKSNKTLVPPGAVLLSKLNPEIPRVWLTQAGNGHRQIASTEFLAYTGKNGAQRGMLFCLFSDDGFRAMLQSMVTGTSKSHQRISPTGLLRREVLTGKSDLFGRFEEMIAPILNRVLANRAESRTLAQTRDLLLPRLMSGELRVADLTSSDQETAA